VQLKDVGEVEDGLADDRQIIRFNGVPTWASASSRSATTTPCGWWTTSGSGSRRRSSATARRTRGQVSTDDSAPIRKIVAALENHLVEGTVLAASWCGSSCAASARH